MIIDKKIQGHSDDLVKRNGSVINTDKGAYMAARARIERQKREQENLNKTKELEKKVESLEQKIDLILQLLGAQSK